MAPNWFMGKLPDDWFTPSGTVHISPSALALAHAFDEQIRQERDDEEWVVAFDWADSRRVREKGTNNWSELGAGIDLAAYEKWKVPKKDIEVIAELEIAVKIPGHVLDASSEKLIDTDNSTFSGLVLR